MTKYTKHPGASKPRSELRSNDTGKKRKGGRTLQESNRTRESQEKSTEERWEIK